MGKELTLQLNHINGDRHDHKRDNLEFLCPNCHTQTETWGGRNKNRRVISDKEVLEALKATRSIREAIAKVGMSRSKTTYNRFKELKLSLRNK